MFHASGGPAVTDNMAAIELIGVRKRFSPAHRGGVALTNVPLPFAAVSRSLGIDRSVTSGRRAAGPFALAVDLLVREGKTLVVLGPSGCGKTTLLELVAGLEEPDEGRILYDGHDMADVPPGRRRVGMVFQNYALFPHYTSKTNILSYFLFRPKTPELDEEARHRFQRTSEVLGVEIEYLLDRMPGGLSGGEKQRVALGRCITRDPAVFLLDEPFANLDQQLRERYRVSLRRLLQEFGVTTIYVTHDQQEALVLADSIAVMDHGSIVQRGTYDDLYAKPSSLFVASFFNPDPATPAINVFEGTWVSPDMAGKLVGVRPEDIACGPEGYGIEAVVKDLRPIPTRDDVAATVSVGKDEFHARLPAADAPGIGQVVRLRFERLHLFDRARGTRIDTIEGSIDR